MKVLIAFHVFGLICAAIVLIYYLCHRPGPCDSCKYLQQKGGGVWEYVCKKPGSIWEDKFDSQPKYCASYRPRDDQTHI